MATRPINSLYTKRSDLPWGPKWTGLGRLLVWRNVRITQKRVCLCKPEWSGLVPGLDMVMAVTHFRMCVCWKMRKKKKDNENNPNVGQLTEEQFENFCVRKRRSEKNQNSWEQLKYRKCGKCVEHDCELFKMLIGTFCLLLEKRIQTWKCS